jgi:3,4-dihydroxy 2-butanone 4-phosphate synthase/GTP cyclohydrolase II
MTSPLPAPAPGAATVPAAVGETPLSPVERLAAELRAGRHIVLIDDDGPAGASQATGAAVCAAESVTPAAVNFLMQRARGQNLGLALTAERCSALRLEPQGFDPDTYSGTAYMTTIDAREGVSTGISAADRAVTIRLAVDEATSPEQLARPGHIFPIRARPGGVLVRAGVPEAAVDLALAAGLRPAAVVCDIHDDDGELAGPAGLRAFAERHGLLIGSVTDIVRHRIRKERLIRRLDTRELATPWGTFDVIVYQSRVDELPHLALTKGGIGKPGPDGEPAAVSDPVLVRVHSECLTGEVFGSQRCECGPQLEYALRAIEEAGRGVLVYLRQEGRGIGLANKLHAYRLQDAGLDTVEANTKLGLPADKRDYGIGSQILRDLGLRRLRLLSNNPTKITGLRGYGLEIVERVPCRVPAGEHNRDYLRVKRDKMGHLLGEES